MPAFMVETIRHLSIDRGEEQTMERVRWGIIGVGDVTERKSGPAF